MRTINACWLDRPQSTNPLSSRLAAGRLRARRALLTCEKIPLENRLIFQFAIFSGLRRGEIFGLRWEDVKLDDDVPHVTVRHSWNSPTKAGKVRELPLLAPAAEALRTWRTRSKPGRLVFAAEHGGCHHKSYDAGWSDKKDRARGTQLGWKSVAGITRHVRFHDLRHTCASHLVSGTWSREWRTEEVRDYIGHANVTVTQRYAHLAPDALRGAVSRTALNVAHNAAPQASRLAPRLAPRRGRRLTVATEALRFQQRARQDSNLRPSA